MGSKQVIVMRKFEKGCRHGKYIAQGAHASVGALLSIGKMDAADENFVIPLKNDPFVYNWIMGNFRKITVYVNTDAELVEIYDTAKKMGIACSLIRDAGLTEFNGVPTLTAVGLGPANEETIDFITGNLPLF